MIRVDDYSGYLRMVCDLGALLTLLMLAINRGLTRFPSEYIALILTILLGAHVLLMSTNFVAITLGLELISLSSYVLVGLGQDSRSAEGSFKYFVFGSVLTATMLYGMSILYGVTGTLDFSSPEFAGAPKSPSILFALGGVLTLAAFLFKAAAVPMHVWAPDVYEVSPMPVVALFSVVPKLAGLGVLIQFVRVMDLFGASRFDWQLMMVVVATLSILVGNFSALRQQSPRRMMAYSSIAQTGFMLVGLAAFTTAGIKLTLFYAAVYTVSNYLVFFSLEAFEGNGFTKMTDFQGSARKAMVLHLLLLVGLISLTGLPPVAGFTGKLLIFSGLWDAYEASGKQSLLWLLVFGLINTVVSLFFYLKIPFYSFLKSGAEGVLKIPALLKVVGFLLAALLLVWFFRPDLLMSWINKINFVL
jgi:NADH-quinone oxidoreductase subunit N